MIFKKSLKLSLITLILLMLSTLGICQNGTAVPAAATAPAAPPNRYQLNGPIVDTYQSPFLYVYGTISPNSFENGVIEKVAQDVVDRWKLLRNRIVPLKKDVDVTEADIQKYHLILYGNERSNKIIKQIGPEMPIRFTEDAIIVGDRSYKDYNYGAIFVHPNPLNPAKYVLIYGALSYHGFPDINAVKASETDYVIFNEMSKMTISNVNAKPVEAGYFDKSDPSHWKVKPTPKSEPKLEEETSYQPVPKTHIKTAPRKPAGGKSGTQ
jgi:hypothetical protein